MNMIGCFPTDWAHARKEEKLFRITREDSMKLVNGVEQPTVMRFFASGDTAHVGEWVIPSGGIGARQTEYQTHKGDAAFHVKEGCVTFLMKDTEEAYEVSEGEYMFIPAGMTYKCINYTAAPVLAVFMISAL